MPTGSRAALRALRRPLAVLLLAAAAGTAHAQNDTIKTKKGEEKTVTVTSADYDGLYFSIQKAQTRIKWEEVASVRYGGAPDFYRAMESFTAGKLAEAGPAFDKLAADTKLRPVLRQEVLYAQGLAAQRTGNTDKAAEAWRELLKSFPKSRYLLSTGSNLLSALLAKGDVPGATKALDELLATAKSAGVDPGYQGSFGVLQARLLLEQKKYAEAEVLYSRVASTSGLSGDIVAAARLGSARALHLLGKKADAERVYRELSVADADNDVLAGAWNGLGDLALEEGMLKKDPDRLRQAALCHLRGVVLYGPTQEGTTEEYERALAGASRAFQSSGELESDAERKKLLRARGQLLRKSLQDQFPSSRWLKN